MRSALASMVAKTALHCCIFSTLPLNGEKMRKERGASVLCDFLECAFNAFDYLSYFMPIDSRIRPDNIKICSLSWSSFKIYGKAVDFVQNYEERIVVKIY